MIAGADELRRLDDAELHATVEHLECTVHELRHARGECGLRIRLVYSEQLTAARGELERRTW